MDISKHLNTLRDQHAAAMRSLSMIKGAHLSEDTKIEASDLQLAIAKLSVCEDALQWKRGDWIVAAKKHMPPMQVYRIAGQSMGKSVRMAFEMAKVSEAFGPEYRYAGIPWTLYRACANTPDPIHWLNEAIQHNLTPAGIRQRVGKPQRKDAQSAPTRTLFDL